MSGAMVSSVPITIPDVLKSRMRSIISILLAVSLSWVTTSYACNMEGVERIMARCCCPHEHGADTAIGFENAQGHQETARCCDVLYSAAFDQHQPGVAAQAPTLDLPTLIALPHTSRPLAEPALRFVGLGHPARGPPGVGTRTYLATSRLRL